MLRESGYRVDEHLLQTREAADAIKVEHGVASTPQIFIDGARIGGSDDLRTYLDERVRE